MLNLKSDCAATRRRTPDSPDLGNELAKPDSDITIITPACLGRKVRARKAPERRPGATEPDELAAPSLGPLIQISAFQSGAAGPVAWVPGREPCRAGLARSGFCLQAQRYPHFGAPWAAAERRRQHLASAKKGPIRHRHHRSSPMLSAAPAGPGRPPSPALRLGHSAAGCRAVLYHSRNTPARLGGPAQIPGPPRARRAGPARNAAGPAGRCRLVGRDEGAWAGRCFGY